MKNLAKKLSLNKMTISNLSSSEMIFKVGGIGTGPKCIIISKSCNMPLGCASTATICEIKK